MMKRATIFKILRYCFFALVTLLTLAVLIVLEENQRGKWAWEKYKREAEARGVGFDPRVFIPPPVPDEQNFAITPLLKPLFGADADYKTALAKRLELTSPKADAKKPVLTGMWEGKRVDLAKWREYLDQPDLLQALKKFDPELDEISASLRQPFARFPLHYEDGWPLHIPQLMPLLNLSKLYALRALASLDAGQTDKALSDVGSILGLAESFGDEPLLISQLVRASVLSIGSRVIWEGLEGHRWSESQLTALQSRLERIDLLTSVLRAIRSERACFPKDVSKILNDPKMFAVAVSFEDDPSDRAFKWDHLRLCLKVVQYQNMLEACRFGDDYVLPVFDPIRRRVDVGRIKAGEEELHALREKINPCKFLTWLDTRMVIPTFSKFANTQATIDQAVIACALERYRLAHGAFPDQLDALVPQYLTKLPHDLINGQPLHYRRTDDGLFLLYSVGWNETDDNGTVGMKESHRQDIEQGDWVWRYPSSTGKTE